MSAHIWSKLIEWSSLYFSTHSALFFPDWAVTKFSLFLFFYAVFWEFLKFSKKLMIILSSVPFFTGITGIVFGMWMTLLFHKKLDNTLVWHFLFSFKNLTDTLKTPNAKMKGLFICKALKYSNKVALEKGFCYLWIWLSFHLGHLLWLSCALSNDGITSFIYLTAQKLQCNFGKKHHQFLKIYLMIQ